MTDENTSYAAVAVRKDVLTTPSLVVRCSAPDVLNDTDYRIIINMDDYMGAWTQSSTPYRYRIDKEPVRPSPEYSDLGAPDGYYSGSVSTEGDAFFIKETEAPELLTALREGGSVTFEVKDYRGTAHVVRFPLRGSSAAIGRLACIPKPTDEAP